MYTQKNYTFTQPEDRDTDYGRGQPAETRRVLTPQQRQVYFARRREMVPLVPVVFGLEFDEAALAFWGS